MPVIANVVTNWPQAEEQADVDVAENRCRHEVVGEGTEQDVEEVPDEEECGHREDEAAELRSQLLELRADLHVDERLGIGYAGFHRCR